MNPGMIIGLVIISIVALIIIIGISQYRTKDVPIGFYNIVDPPKKRI